MVEIIIGVKGRQKIAKVDGNPSPPEDQKGISSLSGKEPSDIKGTPGRNARDE
jgi:hypothetical protein